MKNKDDIRDELNEISPFLANRKESGEGFQVPKNYFSSLPDEVMQKVQTEASPIEEARPTWLDGLADFLQSIFQPRYALAYASVAVLMVAGVYLWKNESHTIGSSPLAEVEIADLSDETIENYLSENIETISTDMFEAYFADGEIQRMPSLELDEMEEYLHEDIDDIRLEELEELF